ncbi:hypothetical protein [Paracoccus aminovorans]|uniref:hypothetical protein n=1 Tax=Paracoccus aminovorans TaxID=34004 RepID=UPI00147BD884|nr:hypothetical protein [Paracoccus aminovorans]
MAGPRFDDSLSVLVATLADLVDGAFVEAGTALRDASGHLTFIAGREPENDAERQKLGSALIEALGSYARTDRSISFRGDSGSERLLAAPEWLPIKVGNHFCQVIDRRVVGAGWLDEPAPVLPILPGLFSQPLKEAWAAQRH